MWITIFLVTVVACVRGLPINSNNCGYKSCKVVTEDTLNVHIVPHSHDDVGWLKTVDQYYYGGLTQIQRAGVQYIIDSVVRALDEDENRRFIQVETAFFHKWWKDQTPKMQNLVRRLVNNGQLEFIGGAWSMNDEAASHYHSLIDQFSLGLLFLNETFGECGRPKVGWQIDPFGHSKEMATLFAQLRYDGLFFARLDWRDKGTRMRTRTPEMIWRGSESLGNDSNLFTSVLYNHYSAPPGFCFDVICQDDPIVTDNRSREYNYQEKVKEFASFVKRQANNFITNNIIITMGDDFNYQDAFYYFKNLDYLINGFKKFPQTYKNKRINVFYSTPSCYIKAVNDEANKKKIAFPVKTDDFFPYASDYHSYWSGYFTSRPTSKRFERQANNFLQVHKQLSSQNRSSENSFFQLQDAVGIMQHHDAITGTEKQHVADDYATILDEAVANSELYVNEMISKLLSKDNNFDLKLKNCLLANISVCHESNEKDFIVAVYNPMSHPTDYYVRLPVNGKDFIVTGPNGENLSYQISNAITDFDSGLYYHSKHELVFLVENLKPLSVKIIRVTRLDSKEYGRYQLYEDTSSRRFKLGTEENGMEIDRYTGLLKNVKVDGSTLQIKQEIMFYNASMGDNTVFESRSSGAYIFRPQNNTEAMPIATSSQIASFKGPLFDEVYQNISSWAKQVFRYYKHTKTFEFDWVIGPIPIDNGRGKEVISRFSTPVNSSDVFYTDSNGKEMLKRIRNHRATYQYSKEEPIAGNYYPVVSKISLKDKELEVSIINDRAQGGTSLKSGEVELMLHRRLLKDDAFGVAEALNEYEFGRGLLARGSHNLVVVGNGYKSKQEEKMLRIQKDMSPWVLVSSITMDANVKKNLDDYINFEYSGLKKDMPENVQILTLEPHPNLPNSLIIRLEHIYEVGEHPILSKHAKIDLSDMFVKFRIVSMRETTLAANQFLDENESFDWYLGKNLEEANYTDEIDTGNVKTGWSKTKHSEKSLVITLRAAEIKTFIANIVYV